MFLRSDNISNDDTFNMNALIRNIKDNKLQKELKDKMKAKKARENISTHKKHVE
jgi:hypothetical protein